MIEAVIFDMDGLMFDTERPSIRFWQEVLAERGFRLTDAMASRIRGGNEAHIRRTLEELFGPDLDFRAAQDAQYERMRRLDEGALRIKPGLAELLAWLEERRIPRAIASSSLRGMIDGHLAAAGLAGRFDAILSGEMVSRSKPDPEIFLKAAAALGVPPARCLVLEDSPNGVRAGAAGGFVTVMVPDMDPPTPELAARFTAAARDLHEVLGWLRAGRL